MNTVIIGVDPTGRTVSTNIFYALYAPTNTTTTSEATQTRNVMPVAGNLSRFFINCTAGPGVGITRTFILRKNGVDTGVSVTLTGTGTGAGINTGSDLVNSVSYVAGDIFTILNSASATTESSGATRWAVQSDNSSNISMVLSGTAVNLTAAATNYVPIQGRGIDGTATNEQGVVPTDGTFKNAYVLLSGSPGSTKNYVATLYKNGSPTALVVTVSGAVNTTGNDTSNTVSVVAGDILYWSIDVDSGATTRVLAISMEFDPTIDGESIHVYSSNVATTNSAVRYNAIASPNAASYQSSEINRQVLTLAAVWKKLYVVQVTASGGSASYQYQLSLETVSGNPSVTLTGATTTGNDTTNTVTATDGQKVVMKLTPTSTPSATVVSWGIVSYIVPTSVKDLIGGGFIPFAR